MKWKFLGLGRCVGYLSFSLYFEFFVKIFNVFLENCGFLGRGIVGI